MPRLPLHRILRASAMLWMLTAVLLPAWASEPRTEHAAELEYRVFETASASAEDRLPLVVVLHYSNTEPEAMIPAFIDLAVPARVVVPRGPYPRSQGRSWFPTGYSELDENAQRPLNDAAQAQLLAFVQAVQQAHPSRGLPVIAGVSYGGDLSLMLALDHPGRFAASFPVAARFPLAWWPLRHDCAQMSCTPIHALHGDADTTVPMAPMQTHLKGLAASGYPARLTVYPGVTHDFDADMQRDLRADISAVLQGQR